MKILVTGASGFIGRHCVRLLVRRGYEVHAVTHGPARSPSDVIWHRADLLEAGTPRSLIVRVRPTHLLHLAWCTEHGRFWTDSANLDWVAASTELIREASEQGCERVVWAGSCAEYDWSADGPLSEGRSALRPATLYGASKHALAELLRTYLLQQGTSHAWGRVFFAYGPGEQATRLVAAMTRALLKGQPARLANAAQRRDFLYVADVATAFLALLEGRVGGAVNIASGRATALLDVVLLLARRLGREDLVEAEPAAETADPAVIVGDDRRLREEVGWSPSYDLEAGLERTLEYWQREDPD